MYSSSSWLLDNINFDGSVKEMCACVTVKTTYI